MQKIEEPTMADLPPGSLPAWVNRRWVALRLLDGDRTVADWLRSISENDLPRRRIS